VLAASYSVGFLAGAPLGGWIAERNVRATVIAGLLLFAAAAAAFGLSADIALLDSTRALQGVAGGIIWGGGLVWLIATTPAERRGSALGAAFAAATAGTLLGPVLGTAAVAGGGGPVFGALGACALLLAACAHRAPAPPAFEPARRIPLALALRRPPLAIGAWLTALTAATLGLLGVLVPLRLAASGASGLEVGITFLAASALAAATAPLAGALGDRLGPLAPLRGGLAVLAPCLLALALAHSPLAVALLAVVSVAAAAGACLGPCVALVASASERASISLAAAVAALNLAFAAGESVGATAGPGLAQALGETAILLAACSAVLITAATITAPVARGALPRVGQLP
jgi:MFS transporter, DHA1 family, solute carrier family 18 (vesicular amine transporter), member 1/2